MKNLGELMKQAQQMQSRMAELQSELAAEEITGVAGAGLVEVVLNGKGAMRRLKIDPSMLDPAEVEVMEDLILAAHNDAKLKVDARAAEKMSELTGGLELPPGMQLPF